MVNNTLKDLATTMKKARLSRLDTTMILLEQHIAMRINQALEANEEQLKTKGNLHAFCTKNKLK